jgi:hypothetical protein
MRKARVLLLLLGLCWFSGQGMILYAQEQNEDEEEDSDYFRDGDFDSDWDGYITETYSRGDQTFTMSLGAGFPVLFLNNGKVMAHHIKPPVGGAGALGYTYFINPHLFFGAEIGVQIFYTLGRNTLFLVPIGARGGWQFLAGRFEFPLALTIGMAIQRYLNNNYLGLYIKGGASGYFRFNPDWSFGLSADWNWFPQWPKENGERIPKKDMYANTVGVTLAARYHF